MPVQGIQIVLSTGLAASALAGDGSHGVLRVMLRNSGNAGTVYLGSSGVTTSGYRLTTADNPLPLTLYPTETIYGITTGGAASVDVLRMNETT